MIKKPTLVKEIKFTDQHQQQHFDFFNNFDQPHFNICANVDITHLHKAIKERALSFTPVMVYFISKAANDIPVFRRRIRADKIVQHEFVHPSFAIRPDNSPVMSFCPVTYQPHFEAFYEEAIAAIAYHKINPTVEDEEHRDDYLFLSVLPWISFTGVVHAMNYRSPDSVPRIVWGKFFEAQNRILMPLSVQAHHAVVDGVHVGQYFELFQQLVNEF